MNSIVIVPRLSLQDNECGQSVGLHHHQAAVVNTQTINSSRSESKRPEFGKMNYLAS